MRGPCRRSPRPPARGYRPGPRGLATIARCPKSRSCCPRASTIRCASWPNAAPRARTAGGRQLAAPRAASPSPRPDRVYVLLDPQQLRRRRGQAGAARRRDPGADHPALRRAAAGSTRPIRTCSCCGGRDRCSPSTSGPWWRSHALGIRARLVRPGYTRVHDHFDPDRDRPIDVVFLGAHSLRRTRYLNHAARVLARLNCARAHRGPEPVRGRDVLVADRQPWPLLAQTKVVINLHCGERTRAGVALGSSTPSTPVRCVVTEHSSGIAPLVAGEHLLVASADSLPFVAESLVRDPERLAALRTAAYERLSRWIPFALPVAVLRAAIVELVGEPVPRGRLSRRRAITSCCQAWLPCLSGRATPRHPAPRWRRRAHRRRRRPRGRPRRSRSSPCSAAPTTTARSSRHSTR